MGTDVPPVVERAPTTVRFVQVDDEISQIRAAWLTLETAVGSMRGRHFVGAFDPGQGWYRACVEAQADVTPAERVLPEAVIPGGRFARARLRGEPPGVYDEIAPAYERLEHSARRDDSRPSLEVYRRRHEIDVLMPVTGVDTAGSHPSTGDEISRSGTDPGPSGAQTRLGLAIVLAVVLVCAVLVAIGLRPGGRGVQDGDLSLVVDQAQVVDILAPAQVAVRVEGTLKNPADDPVTVSAASLGGFAQPLSVTVPAHGSAPVTLTLQVSCDTKTQPPPSMATTLTVSAGGWCDPDRDGARRADRRAVPAGRRVPATGVRLVTRGERLLTSWRRPSAPVSGRAGSRPGGRTGRHRAPTEADVTFIQVIDYHTSKADEMKALGDEWETASADRQTTARVIVVQDREDRTHYQNIVFFDSYETAMANSDLPETNEFAKRMMDLVDGPTTFLNLDVIEDRG